MAPDETCEYLSAELRVQIGEVKPTFRIVILLDDDLIGYWW